MVFGRDQESLICFKAIPLGIRCPQAEKVFVLRVFSVCATPATPPLAARKSPSIHVYSPAHTRSPRLAARLHNVRFGSFRGMRGGRARGRDPLEELRNAGAFLHTRVRLPLAPSRPGFA